ncbi:MAG: GNAT family N-acetyltransferase [Nitrospinae bacterium]|nr:GNAT family N-acetyltransferase [Nitrospinota bacterium]
MILSISIIENEKEFEELHSQWDNLLKVSAANSIFLTHEWLFTWWRHFGKGKRLSIITIRREGELIGIAPLMCRKLVPACFKQGGILEFIGTPFNDEADFMAHKDFFRDALSAITRFLIKDYPLWDIINLREIPVASLTLKILNETAGENKILCSNWIRSISPFIKTGGGWNKFIKDKGSKFRNNLKRAERLAGQAGQIEYEVFKEQDITDEVIKRVFDVERRSWKEKGGTPLLSGERNRKFFGDIGKIFSLKNWMVVYILKLDGRDIAFQMCFDYNEKIWEYTTAYDRDYSKVSPGTMILNIVVKDTFDKKKREYDFLRGDEQYKRMWAEDKREMMQIGIVKKGIYPLLYFYINMKLRAILNKNPILVSIYDTLMRKFN